jgi:hypothetical protein
MKQMKVSIRWILFICFYITLQFYPIIKPLDEEHYNGTSVIQGVGYAEFNMRERRQKEVDGDNSPELSF